LVVVRKQDGVTLLPASNQGLPTLEIKAPALPGVELPDLSESHLWVHAQIAGVDKAGLASALASQPTRTASRLLSPRRLDPTTDYIACFVPAFETGRQAGLGQAVTETTLKPAWASGANAPTDILLPVYISWQFRTGAARDFETLARRLKPNELPPEAGKQPMDIGHPGFVMNPQPAPNAPGTTLGLEGALRAVNSQSDDWPDPVRLPFQTSLAEIVNTPWELSKPPGSNADPILAPPVYGCWYAGAHEVKPVNSTAPPWLNELNLDPRHRAVAAMGTQVIQVEQEQLMASAWEQLGDIEKINQRLRQAQLSRAVNTTYHQKTFNRLPDGVFMNVVAPAQSRLMVSDPSGSSLLVQRLAATTLPASAFSAPMRRLARPRGAINRQFSRAGAGGIQGVFRLFTGPPVAPPSGGIVPPSFIVPPSRGAVTIDAVSAGIPEQIAIVRDHTTGTETKELLVLNPGPPPFWQHPPVGLPIMLTKFKLINMWFSAMQSLPPTTPPDFGVAVQAHHQYLTTLFTTFIIAIARLTLDTKALRAAVMLSLTPAKTVADAAQGSVDRGSPALLSGDNLDPIMDAPSFPQPMYEGLRDLSQDYFFPGLDQVPPDTVQLLQTNAKFIESFMVGLNTEMGRELLWRGYPTDQRGTYFQNFWDATAVPPGVTPPVDINPPIHLWGSRELGATAVGAGGDKLVLLIRGELLRRYPGTIIYAVKALVHGTRRVLASDFPSEATPPFEAYPVFRGTLNPDVTFLGFDLTPTEVLTGPGWFFVLQQQPTEPRFGLDEAPFEVNGNGNAAIPPLQTWNDLNWAHLAPNEEKLKAISYVQVKSVQLTPTQPVKGIWGRNSGHMAYITLHLPVRVAFHASELLK